MVICYNDTTVVQKLKEHTKKLKSSRNEHTAASVHQQDELQTTVDEKSQEIHTVDSNYTKHHSILKS